MTRPSNRVPTGSQPSPDSGESHRVPLPAPVGGRRDGTRLAVSDPEQAVPAAKRRRQLSSGALGRISRLVNAPLEAEPRGDRG